MKHVSYLLVGYNNMLVFCWMQNARHRFLQVQVHMVRIQIQINGLFIAFEIQFEECHLTCTNFKNVRSHSLNSISKAKTGWFIICMQNVLTFKYSLCRKTFMLHKISLSFSSSKQFASIAKMNIHICRLSNRKVWQFHHQFKATFAIHWYCR